MPNIKDEILEQFKVKFKQVTPFMENSEQSHILEVFLSQALDRYLQEALKELPEKLDEDLEKFIDSHHYSHAIRFNSYRSQFLQNLKDKGFIE